MESATNLDTAISEDELRVMFNRALEVIESTTPVGDLIVMRALEACGWMHNPGNDFSGFGGSRIGKTSYGEGGNNTQP